MSGKGVKELAAARLALLLLVDLDDDAVDTPSAGRRPPCGTRRELPSRQLLAVAVREIEVDLVLDRIKGFLQLFEEPSPYWRHDHELRRHVGVFQAADLARDGTELGRAAPALLLGPSVVLAVARGAGPPTPRTPAPWGRAQAACRWPARRPGPPPCA